MFVMSHVDNPSLEVTMSTPSQSSPDAPTLLRPQQQQQQQQQQARKFPSYGYHNSFHTHCVDELPPTYNIARIAPLQAHKQLAESSKSDVLPAYTCSVQREAVVSVCREFKSPFAELEDEWQERYAVLRGTKLWIHRVKSSGFKGKEISQPGKLVRAYTLQHAEVGIAVDVGPAWPVPKHSFIRMLSKSSQAQMFSQKPEMFKPVREWLVRLRVEAEQITLAFDAQNDMLDWAEDFCAAIDISLPLEDRSDPRYRSLPRRNRRQRQLEGLEDAQPANMSDLSERLVLQQARILAALYPNLGSNGTSGGVLPSTEPEDRNERDTYETSGSALRRMQSSDADAANQDPDTDDLDPADVTEAFDLSRVNTRTGQRYSQTSQDSAAPIAFDPKVSPRPRPLSSNALIRYRRRCAPIMSRHSPRASDIILVDGARYRVDSKRERLAAFETSPPRYCGDWNKDGRFTWFTHNSMFGTTSTTTPQIIEPHSNRSSGIRRTENDGASMHSSASDPSDADAISPALTATSTRNTTLMQSDSTAQQLTPTTTFESVKNQLLREKPTGILRRRDRIRSEREDEQSRMLSVGLAGLVI
jgi:hypothetical protein